MQTILTCLKLATGGVLLALITLGLVMAPGFLSDRDSTVPQGASREARR